MPALSQGYHGERVGKEAIDAIDQSLVFAIAASTSQVCRIQAIRVDSDGLRRNILERKLFGHLQVDHTSTAGESYIRRL